MRNLMDISSADKSWLSSAPYAATAGALVFAGLYFFDMRLDLCLLALIFVTGLFALTTLRPYQVLFVILIAVMGVNLANYTFLSYNIYGEPVQGTGLELVALTRLPLAILVVAWGVKSFGATLLSFYRKNWDIVILMLIPFFSLLFALDTRIGFRYAVWFFVSLLAVLTFIFALSRAVQVWKSAEQIAWLFLVSNVFLVALGLGGVVESDGIAANTPYTRTLFGDTNIHAVGCAVVLSALLVVDRHRGRLFASKVTRRLPSFVYIVLGIATIVPLFLSAKRSAIGAAAFATMAYFWANSSISSARSRRGLLKAVVVVGLIGATVWLSFPMATGTIDRFEKAVDPERNTSLQDRLEIVETSLLVFREYPILGVGLENSKIARYRLAPLSDAAMFSSHNTPLAILVELGLIGFALFVIVVARSVRLALRLSPDLRWNLVILAIPPLLISLTESNLAPGQALFWPLWISLVFPRLALASDYRENPS